ncbi:glycosomal membrane protein [Diplonema papillatum]|nr:glycosomal membrane protein [Diplonema papillatum]|eukprot:gene15440-23603_t
MTTPTDRAVKLLKGTDGRDKLYKLAAALAKLIAFNAIDAAKAKRFNTVAKSMGDARSIMRMGKWIQKNQEVSKEVDSLSTVKCDTTRAYMKIFRLLGDIGYIVGDNVQWLSKYDLVGLDQKRVSHGSKVCQFWGFLMSCWLQLYDLLLHYGKSGTLRDSTSKKLLLNFVRDFCDMLAALSSINYIPSFQPTAGTVATFGLLSSTIACHQNWKATA